MTTRIKLRRDTEANWNLNDPVLALGEPGYDTTNNKIKVGDGTTAWSSLSYLTDAAGGELGNYTFNGDVITNANGMIVTTDRGTITFGADIEAPGDSTHFHVAFENSNVVEPSAHLYLGDDYNYFKVESGRNGVRIGASDGGNPTRIWNFNTDGSLMLPEAGDIVNSLGNSVLDTVVEREVNFPTGEAGDTIGTLALDNGDLYVSIGNYTSASPVSYSGSTAEEYSTGQHINQDLIFILPKSLLPDVTNILNSSIFPSEWTVECNYIEIAGQPWQVNDIYTWTASVGEYAGQECWAFDVGYLGQSVVLPADTSFTVNYTAGMGSTIWSKILNTDNNKNIILPVGGALGFSFGYIDQDTEVDADALRISGGTGVTIKTNMDNTTWRFNNDGSLLAPSITTFGWDGSGSYNSPTLILGELSMDSVVTNVPYDTNTRGGYNLRIMGQRGYGDWSDNALAGDGTNLQIWAGAGGESNTNDYGGEGGNVEIRGGIGQQGRDGGDISIIAGDSRFGNAEQVNTVTGGHINIEAGDATLMGGIPADKGNGGDINLSAGVGTLNNGEITLTTADSHNWIFKNDGTLMYPDSTVQTTAYQTNQITVLLNTSTENMMAGYTFTGLAPAIVFFTPDAEYVDSNLHVVYLQAPTYPGQKVSLISNYNGTIQIIWPWGESTNTITLQAYENSELTAINHPDQGLTYWETNRYSW